MNKKALALCIISTFNMGAAMANTALGEISLKAKGGIAPTIYTKKGGVDFAYNGAALAHTSIPNFTKSHNLPSLFGGEVGYGVMEDTEVFLEGAYQSSKGKKVAFGAFAGQTSTFETYRAVGIYGGARYFIDAAPGSSFFVGAKLGVHHRKETALKVPFGGQTTKFVLYKTDTAFSGGGQLGFEQTLFKNLTIGIQSECVLSDHLKQPKNINTTVSGIPTVFNVGKTGGMISFPITGFIKVAF